MLLSKKESRACNQMEINRTKYNSFIKDYLGDSTMWKCSPDVAVWFSKMRNNREQKNLIVSFITTNFYSLASGKNDKFFELQTHMLITEDLYYKRVLHEICLHIKYLGTNGFSLADSIYIVINIMCNYYYNHDNFVGSLITKLSEISPDDLNIRFIISYYYHYEYFISQLITGESI